MQVFSVDFTVDQEQVVLDAFDGDRAACEAWVRERLVEHTLTVQQTRMQRSAIAEQRAARDELASRLAPQR